MLLFSSRSAFFFVLWLNGVHSPAVSAKNCSSIVPFAVWLVLPNEHYHWFQRFVQLAKCQQVGGYPLNFLRQFGIRKCPKKLVTSLLFCNSIVENQ